MALPLYPNQFDLFLRRWSLTWLTKKSWMSGLRNLLHFFKTESSRLWKKTRRNSNLFSQQCSFQIEVGKIENFILNFLWTWLKLIPLKSYFIKFFFDETKICQLFKWIIASFRMSLFQKIAFSVSWLWWIKYLKFLYCLILKVEKFQIKKSPSKRQKSNTRCQRLSGDKIIWRMKKIPSKKLLEVFLTELI